MKKCLSFLTVLTLLIGLFPNFAYADVITPGQALAYQIRSHAVLIIAVAVLIISLILWLTLRNKK